MLKISPKLAKIAAVLAVITAIVAAVVAAWALAKRKTCPGCAAFTERFGIALPRNIDGGPMELPDVRVPLTGDYLRTVGGGPQREPEFVAADEHMSVLRQ